MTDNEIIKALEICCAERICRKCVYFGKKEFCIANNTPAVLDLINRLQEKDETRHKVFMTKCEELETANAEIERLKELVGGKND